MDASKLAKLEAMGGRVTTVQELLGLTDEEVRAATKSCAVKALEEIAGAPLSFGAAVESMRKCNEYTQVECAKKLGISKSHLCDVEKGRKTVRAGKAAKWARALGYPESVLVRLSLQAQLDVAGLKYKVTCIGA